MLVFIHGESFDWGSSQLHDGSVLASYANVVVVTLNFRLGALGKYLCPVQFASSSLTRSRALKKRCFVFIFHCPSGIFRISRVSYPFSRIDADVALGARGPRVSPSV